MLNDLLLWNKIGRIIVLLGERLGIPTPYNSVFADIISCVQDNYDNQYGMANG